MRPSKLLPGSPLGDYSVSLFCENKSKRNECSLQKDFRSEKVR